ncbi:MAG: outer membrane beta-barrel protein [Holophagaceae bacterium]|nr:outer membrane beta-barrel protein [Holophagaceae bacterium]
MKITRFLTAILFASSATMSAQDDKPLKPYVALGFALAQGHAHDMTQKTWGGFGAYAAEVGIQFDLPQTDVQLRPNLGMTRILGDKPNETHPKIYDLVGIYLGVDIVYSPFESLPLTITTGPSFHTWNVDEVDSSGIPNQGDKGMKLGWRVGTTYVINKKFSVTMDFTLTEWRKDKSSTVFVPGFNPSRPAYFTLKGAYRF